MTLGQSISLSEEFGASVLEVPKKVTVIRLRWLVVIICSYLLVSSQDVWLSQGFINAFILFYILSNFGLYYFDDELFDSSYFYSPLVVFDTLFVTAALVMSGQVGTDFYLAYFLVVILCTIWQDFRGLIAVAFLSTLLYGYFLFRTAEPHDPSIYLRLPFLFVISLFYGYFAQVVRVEKGLKEQAEQEAQDMAMIQSLSQSLPASLDYRQILQTVRDKISNVVHAAKIYIFIFDETEEASRAVFFSGDSGDIAPEEVDLAKYPIVQECVTKRGPVIQHHLGPHRLFAESPEDGRDFSFPSALAVPISFRSEIHGVILLGFHESDRVLTSREVQFCQIVAFSSAIALSNAKKYEDLQEEAQRRKVIANQLAEANRLKSEYLANTSHELRTPITTILGFGNLLVDGVCGPLSGEQKSAVSRLLENARGLLGIVDEVLDYSKLERGDIGLAVKRQEVGPLIEQLRQHMAPLEANKPYKVSYEVGHGVPPIATDWAKLKSVLVNILSNALKFTNEGRVRFSVVNGTGKNEVLFLVSDTGIGIPKDQIPLIFEKFRQVDGSSTRRYQGTGLGLTISKNLVELLGGRIEVESDMGKGSTFKVTIPVTTS